MKTIQFILFSILIVMIMGSCANDDEPEVTLFQQNGSWNCTVTESCQDVYEFNFTAGSRISISVEEVTGKSVVNLAVYAPGVVLGGTNLLTGSNNESSCAGQDENHGEPNLVLPSSGVYKVAVTRDWGQSAGTDGQYRLTIISDTPYQTLTQTIDDVDSEASGKECL